MKFCYFDESGMGNEPYLVMVGIIVDAKRMHITKDIWANFLSILSQAAGRQIEEFHARDFYRGNRIWRGIDGATRAEIIKAILKWVEGRKHKCLFSGLNKAKFEELSSKDKYIKNFKSKWCAAALHCTLQIQKQHQRENKPKGHSVLIFDREVMEETNISSLIHKPPTWINTYYNRKNGQDELDQIVDVPFFADSKHILLSQIADLFAYILRTYAEVQDNLKIEKYKGEKGMLQNWTESIIKLSLARAIRYPIRGRCKAAQLFWDLAPPSIKEL